MSVYFMQGTALAQGTPAETAPGPVKTYLAAVQADLQTARDRGDRAAETAASARAALAAKVATQVDAHPGAYPLGAAPFTYFTVPAISPIKRLPDVFPTDGALCGTLRVVAARDEFEPASFVVFPFANAAKAELKASALRGAAGVIPAGSMDLKIV